jgi:hypothetical protein
MTKPAERIDLARELHRSIDAADFDRAQPPTTPRPPHLADFTEGGAT